MESTTVGPGVSPVSLGQVRLDADREYREMNKPRDTPRRDRGMERA